MSIFDPKHRYASIDAFYALHLKEFQMNPHVHPRCEIMYVVNGSCLIEVNDSELTLSSREFIFLDEDRSHRLEINRTEPCSILNLEFSCTDQKSVLDLQDLSAKSPNFLAFLQNHEPVCIGTDSEGLGYALKDLIIRLQKNPSQDQYLVQLLFYRVLLELSLCCQKKSSSGSVTYIKKACEYIQTHLTEEIRIPQIAEYAGINKSYLHALFSKYMGCTIVDYINKKRLAQAAFLLSNSSLSVTDISFQAGFNSRQHFSSTFEKHYGMTPRSYRQLNQRLLNASTGQSQIELNSNGRISKTVFVS